MRVGRGLVCIRELARPRLVIWVFQYTARVDLPPELAGVRIKIEGSCELSEVQHHGGSSARRQEGAVSYD